jgi:hypothetical protein
LLTKNNALHPQIWDLGITEFFAMSDFESNFNQTFFPVFESAPAAEDDEAERFEPSLSKRNACGIAFP